MPDGREVSRFWGGGRNRDGTKKRSKLSPASAKVRRKATAAANVARKQPLRKRFKQHRAELEGRKQWSGPRKFEDWLLVLAERELQGVAAVSQVCSAEMGVMLTMDVCRGTWIA